MLTLYHHPLSANSRRVWILLLEKNLPFELVPLKLDGDQLQPEFLKLNPFHQVPVLVDDGLRVVESLAILDYLETKYPTPPMLPISPQAVGVVRMVQLLTITTLRPALTPLTYQMLGVKTYESQVLETARQEVETVFKFFEQLLGDQPYFGGEALTLAEITASPSILSCRHLDVSLQPFARLQTWCERLLQRPPWQTTEPSVEAIAAFKQTRS